MKKINKANECRSGKLKQEAIEQVNYNRSKPKISLEFLQGKYCVSKCQKHEKAQIIDTLHKISQHTWQEIIQEGKYGFGYEQIEVSQLKCALPQNTIFDNLDKVTVFHNTPKIPIIGFRIQDTYYIFCIDRNYKAYNHGGS